MENRLKFYAYVDPANVGYMFLFATWINESPSKQNTNIIKLHVSTMGYMDVNSNGTFTNASELQPILAINSYTARVGIGTTSPGATLTVNGEIGIQEAGAQKYNIDYNNGGLHIAETGVDEYRIFIKDGGNVGIGTNNPQAKLAVNGDIFSKKVKVTQTGWPDYVFQSAYQLPSLQYVEQFIQQHKHLPEVPSAKEVEENGLDVGENQAMLLKKIEELTLYIIEQNKKIESLKAQSQELHDIKKELEIIKNKTSNLNPR